MRKLWAGVLASCLAMAAMPLPATAQLQYPERPVRTIVPYEAGGATDIMARSMADRLAQAFGRPFVIENRPGGGGTLGTVLAAQSAPDGYTLFLGQVSSHGIAPSLYARLQYDPLADFVPVGRIGSIPNVLVVKASSPYRSVADIVAAARRQPGRLTFASAGNGTSIHLTGEMFKARTGTDMLHVPFKGSASALAALLGGQVDMIFDNLPSSLPHIRSGGLRALAVSSAERNPALPDIPTLREITEVPELKDFVAVAWNGVLAPRGTPEPIVQKLNEAMNEILASDSFRSTLAGFGATPDISTPPAFRSFIEAEIAKWGGVVREAGARVE
ncbi:tripartite tricarboxylate transporter substrate binding protein [Roseomonas sp. GC11]|uniref:Bug family tripartite tricarboxylate transporter substrate binding protein n=1 Tax=Roseomonas sp. GC11 TaxID=2950546 RepID=UPI00210B8918|nr:tripartite tricarboxylate transporter substrate binding protein [Roseomonas sp. GC11]MCQ4160535.1 tripartite tricarboxylate transporter substrate binding protein [Roseomonas sp. GC11]